MLALYDLMRDTFAWKMISIASSINEEKEHELSISELKKKIPKRRGIF